MDLIIKIFFEMLLNFPLMMAVASMAIAQIIKIAYYYVADGEFDLYHFVEAGGMPSAHSAMMTALTISIGLTSGWTSPVFAIGFILSLVVMYDAMGVRRAASQQAFILNTLVDDMYAASGGKIEKLKEIMGHSPIEVVFGSILGACVSFMFYFLIFILI